MSKECSKLKLFLLVGLCAFFVSCSFFRQYRVNYFDNLNQNNKCKEIDYKIINKTKDSAVLKITIKGIRNPDIESIDAEKYSCIHIVDDDKKKHEEFLVLLLPDESSLVDKVEYKSHKSWIPFELELEHSFRIGLADEYFIKCGERFKEISELKKNNKNCM